MRFFCTFFVHLVRFDYSICTESLLRYRHGKRRDTRRLLCTVTESVPLEIQMTDSVNNIANCKIHYYNIIQTILVRITIKLK